jgi:hypothetical protein
MQLPDRGRLVRLTRLLGLILFVVPYMGVLKMEPFAVVLSFGLAMIHPWRI